MAGQAIRLSEKAQCQLRQLFVGTQTYMSSESDRYKRMEIIDRKYSMEHSKAARENKKGKLDPTVVPTVLTHIETIVSQLTEMFLTGYPIFSPIASPQYAEEMSAMQGSFAAQARQFAWERNMILFFRDTAKYNRAAIEVRWDSIRLSTVGSDAEGNAKISPQDIDGNRIKRLDPYNIFFDPSVPAAEVHTNGMYAGYTEKVTRVRLHTLLNALDQTKVMNRKDALSSAPNGQVKYFRPTVNAFKDESDSDGWANFFGIQENGADTEENKGQLFYYTVMYVRVIPKEYEINIPGNDIPAIFQIIIVNGCHIVYVEALTDSHQYLPIIISEITEDGLNSQTKSYAERLIPVQNLVSDLHTARIASLRRAVGDRALYDPSKISPNDINSPNPAAKIPVRSLAYGQQISTAYYQIPYTDTQSQLLLSEAAQVDRYAQNISGQNPTSQGQFTPGNKTQTEFTTIMSNANNRSIVLAMMMESQTMVPLKTMLLFNTLQYQQTTLFLDIERQGEVEYNPINARKINWDWEVADGLLPVSKIANPAVYAQAMQTLMQIPDLGQTYKVGDMFAYLMQLQGIRNLKQFAKTPLIS